MKNRNRIFTWTLTFFAWLLIFSTSATMIDNSSEIASEKTEWVSDQLEEGDNAPIALESQASGNLNENESPKPASTVLYTQDFDNGGNMPSGWATYGEGPNYCPWKMELDSGSDYRAECNSYDIGPGTVITEWLYMTDYIDCSGYTSLEIEFYMDYDYGDGGEYAEVRYITSEYPLFLLAQRWDSEDVEGTQILDLSYAAGDPEFRIAFVYHGTFDRYMRVDDILLRGEGHSILIDVSHSPITMDPSDPDYASFYSYIDTVAHRNVDLVITEPLLDNFDALIIPNSEDQYDSSEMTAMVNFRNDGGRIFIIGECFVWLGWGTRNLLLELRYYTTSDEIYDDDDNNNGNKNEIFFDTNNFDSHEIMNGIYDILYPYGGAFTSTPSGTYNLITTDYDKTAHPTNSPVFTVKSDGSGDIIILLSIFIWEEGFKDDGDNWQLLLNIVDWLSDTGSGPGDDDDDDDNDNDDNDDDNGNGDKVIGDRKSDSTIGGGVVDFLLSPIGLIMVGGITASLVSNIIVVWVFKKKNRR